MGPAIQENCDMERRREVEDAYPGPTGIDGCEGRLCHTVERHQA